MFYRYLLILLGLNQTLAIALLPEIADRVNLINSGQGLAMITTIINLNLISYWFGTAFWGKYLVKVNLESAAKLALIGFIGSSTLFWGTLYFDAAHALILIAISRFILGFFTSAFVILAHTYLAKMAKTNLGQLAKTSGTITIGRLIGPSLVLLPLSLDWLLLVPILIAGLLLAKHLLSTTKPVKINATNQVKQKLNEHSHTFKLILVSALLTTSMVSCLQYFLLPLLTSMGNLGEQTSKVYASLLLYLTIIVIFYQFVVLPILSQRIQHLPKWIFLSLLIGCSLLPFSDNLFSLLCALTILAFSISALPNWYCKHAYQNQSVANTAQRSAYISRAHSSGYLLGTALSSLGLYLEISLTVPISCLAILLGILIFNIKNKILLTHQSA